MKHIKAVNDNFEKDYSIAIVSSKFNESITQALRDGALERLKERGVADREITLIEVPGAIEIPLMAQVLAKQKDNHAIIALGAVIRGETSHYDYVCDQVSSGCLKIMLEYEIPVIFGVLTTDNEAQAWDRIGGKYGHKGKEAVDAAIDMISIMKQLTVRAY